MAINILADENCIGQVDAIFRKLDHLGYVELFEVELLTWDIISLDKGANDKQLWHFCQKNHCLLITGNRTDDDIDHLKILPLIQGILPSAFSRLLLSLPPGR